MLRTRWVEWGQTPSTPSGQSLSAGPSFGHNVSGCNKKSGPLSNRLSAKYRTGYFARVASSATLRWVGTQCHSFTKVSSRISEILCATNGRKFKRSDRTHWATVFESVQKNCSSILRLWTDLMLFLSRTARIVTWSSSCVTEINFGFAHLDLPAINETAHDIGATSIRQYATVAMADWLPSAKMCNWTRLMLFVGPS